MGVFKLRIFYAFDVYTFLFCISKLTFVFFSGRGIQIGAV